MTAWVQRMAGNHTFNGKQSEYDQFYNAAQPKDYYPSYLEGGQWQAQRNGEVVTNAKYVSSPAAQSQRARGLPARGCRLT